MSLGATMSSALTYDNSSIPATAVPDVATQAIAEFEVWFDATVGAATNQGTDASVTAVITSGPVDQGDFWSSAGPSQALEVDGYTGELTCNGSEAVGAAGNPRQRGFMVCDMGALSGGSTNRVLASNKTSNSVSAAGIRIRHSAADTAFLEVNLGDGVDGSTSDDHDFNIESKGKVLIFWYTDWALVNYAAVNVVASSGVKTLVTQSTATQTDDFEFAAGMPMVFGAGNNDVPPNAVAGPDGLSGAWDIYAFGYDRGADSIITAPIAAAIAAHYGVI